MILLGLAELSAAPGHVAQQLDVSLDDALIPLRRLYDRVDHGIAARTRDLDLPCAAGCSDCCHKSVRVTLLEALAAADHLAQQGELQRALQRARQLWARLGDRFEAIDLRSLDPTDGDLAFACPFLGEDQRCGVYAMRPMACRLFGQSFDEHKGLYACDLVGRHLHGRELRLPRAQTWLQGLSELPLTFAVHVIPYFLRSVDEAALRVGAAS